MNNMIEFAKVEKKDIPLLISWLRKKHVREFWDKNIRFSTKKITEKYTQRINENKVNMYLIVFKGENIGYIQSYIVDEKECINFKIKGICNGIDIYIGEESMLNKGYGTQVLKSYISNFIFREATSEKICIDPEVANTRAIKVYNKIGFMHVNTAVDGESKLNTYYMTLNYKDFLENIG